MATINHQLRTPLSKLLGHAELLTDAGVLLPPAMQHSARVVARAADQLGHLLETASQLFDLEARSSLAVKPVDLAALLRGAAEEFVASGGCPPERLVVQTPETLLAVVDPRKVDPRDH